MERPLLVSMWAPPGVGKSTIAAQVFSILKLRGHRAELVQEFAKDITYEQNWKAFQDNFFIMASQERRTSRLIGEVDIIVTDSPTGLGLIYCPEPYRDVLRDVVLQCRDRYVHSDWLLTRDPERPYQQYGRTQTEEQSKSLQAVLDVEIRRIAPGFKTTAADSLAGHYIADSIERRLSNGRS